jgi:hypothetical protein
MRHFIPRQDRLHRPCRRRRLWPDSRSFVGRSRKHSSEMFLQTPLQVDCPRCRAMAEFRENCAKARLVFPRPGKEPIELIDPQLAVRSGGHALLNVLTLASVMSLYFIRITPVISTTAATLRFLAKIFLPIPTTEALFGVKPKTTPALSAARYPSPHPRSPTRAAGAHSGMTYPNTPNRKSRISGPPARLRHGFWNGCNPDLALVGIAARFQGSTPGDSILAVPGDESAGSIPPVWLSSSLRWLPPVVVLVAFLLPGKTTK